MVVRLGWVMGFALLASCTNATHSGGASAVGRERSATMTTRTWRHWIHRVVPAQGWITSVDGRHVLLDKVELRPGLHNLVIERDARRPARGVVAACAVSFQAQAGHQYRAASEGADASWHATVHDAQGGVPLPCTPLRPAPLR